jgi:hypothetical protein
MTDPTLLRLCVAIWYLPDTPGVIRLRAAIAGVR